MGHPSRKRRADEQAGEHRQGQFGEAISDDVDISLIEYGTTVHIPVRQSAAHFLIRKAAEQKDPFIKVTVSPMMDHPVK